MRWRNASIINREGTLKINYRRINDYVIIASVIDGLETIATVWGNKNFPW